MGGQTRRGFVPTQELDTTKGALRVWLQDERVCGPPRPSIGGGAFIPLSAKTQGLGGDAWLSSEKGGGLRIPVVRSQLEEAATEKGHGSSRLR